MKTTDQVTTQKPQRSKKQTSSRSASSMWKGEHERRKTGKQEKQFTATKVKKNGKDVAKVEKTVPHTVRLDGIQGRPRPQLSYYSTNGKPKSYRFRARLDGPDKHAMVIRVVPTITEDMERKLAAGGDQNNGLHLLTTGEIVIALDKNEGRPLKFEFRVENPGDGLGDYKC